MKLPLLTVKQKAVCKYDFQQQPIITICEGAVRSGKTLVLLPLWIQHVGRFKGRGVRFIMTGTTVPSLKRNVLDELNNVYGIDTSLNINNEFLMFGNIISCFGAAKADSYKAMKGFTAYGWLGNEVTEHHANTIDQAFKRCSGDGFRIFWDTNPADPLHPIKTDYVDRDGERLDDGREHIKVWHFTLDDNEFLPPVYREHLKKITPSGHYYDRDILGQWVSAEGMIYKDFNYAVHVIPAENLPKDADGKSAIKEYIAGVDWGYDHLGCIGLYGVDHDKNAYRIKEIVDREKSIDWWIERAKELQTKHGNVLFYCDTARPDNISAFRNAGLNVRGAEKDVVAGIAFVASMFKNNKLFIVRDNNKNYLRTIYNYRWLDGSSIEAPIKDDDDSMDTERYALYSHFGKPKEVKAVDTLYR